jgi:hypothetical protein
MTVFIDLRGYFQFFHSEALIYKLTSVGLDSDRSVNLSTFAFKFMYLSVQDSRKKGTGFLRNPASLFSSIPLSIQNKSQKLC